MGFPQKRRTHKPQRKTPKTPPGSTISPIDLLSKKQFDKLHKEHALILQKIDELKNMVPPLVTPELEEQIKTAAGLALGIDRKVPDKNVPPGQ